MLAAFAHGATLPSKWPIAVCLARTAQALGAELVEEGLDVLDLQSIEPLRAKRRHQVRCGPMRVAHAPHKAARLPGREKPGPQANAGRLAWNANRAAVLEVEIVSVGDPRRSARQRASCPGRPPRQGRFASLATGRRRPALDREPPRPFAVRGGAGRRPARRMRAPPVRTQSRQGAQGFGTTSCPRLASDASTGSLVAVLPRQAPPPPLPWSPCAPTTRPQPRPPPERRPSTSCSATTARPAGTATPGSRAFRDVVMRWLTRP